MDVLEQEIRVIYLEIQSTPNGHPKIAMLLNNLGNMLTWQYERTKREEHLEESIRVSRWAVQVTSHGHSIHTMQINNLVRVLLYRYNCMNKTEDLEEAIQLLRQALETSPSDSAFRQSWILNLSIMLQRLYERSERMEHLEEAIQLIRQALETSRSDSAFRQSWILDLSILLQRLYERSERMEHLEEAIQIYLHAIEATPDGHPDLSTHLESLGNMLAARYKRTRRMEDLEEAIRRYYQAIETIPHEDPFFPSWLENLACALTYRYERTGQMANLDKAIDLSHQALNNTPRGHQYFANHLNNLVYRLVHRYERTGGMESLNEAKEASRQLFQDTPNDNPDCSGWLGTLGLVLTRQYERTKSEEDLEEAIQVSRRALETTPDGHPYRKRWSNNLANLLENRYSLNKDMEDLKEAIYLSRQALQGTTCEHIHYALYLNSLGTLLATRYESTGHVEDSTEAIWLLRQALQATVDDHPNLAGQLGNLGKLLGDQYEQTKQIEDLEGAIHMSCKAVEITSAPPLERVKAAHLALELLLKQQDYIGGYEVSVKAIDILQLVHKRSLALQDRQYVVSHFAGLATQACSLAIQTQKPLFEALRLLENGRGVILGLLLDDRSDTSKLKETHPALCAQYESLRLEVNTPLESTTSQWAAESVSARRPKAIEELEKCIQDIRHLPKFGTFQQGHTAEQIRNASNEGSIIVVNVTNLRSDSIIISPSGFSLVPLPRFSAVQAQYWVDQKLTSASPSERGVKNKLCRQFLAWLWSECVKPVLNELGHSIQNSLEGLPRVWWIGTGLASSFPFHAACDISAEEYTFCRVLSSYTPSIRALLHARERVPISTLSNGTPSKLLVVTMAKTPGANDLPGVMAERSTVLGALGTSVQVEVLDQPDSASVIRKVRECNIAHFACHGSSDSRDPIQSGLLLQTTTADPRQEILTVLKLCENHPTLGEIAYLSACSTAENQAKGLIDEALHVVSGFQVAGFRHVIGTLWPSDDSVCVDVARMFYAELCRNGNPEYTDRTVAKALHKAVSDVSTGVEYRKRPLHWAQFVHYGA